MKSIPEVVPNEKGESYPKLGIGELMQKKSDKLLNNWVISCHELNK